MNHPAPQTDRPGLPLLRQKESWLSLPMALALIWAVSGTLWLCFIAAKLSTDPTLLAINHPENSTSSVHQAQAAMLLIMLPMLIFGWLAGPVLSRANGRITRYWPLLFAGFVALMLARLPVVSDDLYRYIHDGGVVASGQNPYRYPPASYAAHQAPDPATVRRINHPELSTIYLPFSQLCFAAWFWLGKTLAMPDMVTWFRGLMLLAQAVTAAGLLRILERLSLPPARLGLYLCAPVALVEVLLFAHQDVLGIAAMVWALALLPMPTKNDGVAPSPHAPQPVSPGRAAAIAALIATAGCVKPQALVMGLPLFCMLTTWRARAAFVLSCAAAVTGLFACMIALGPGSSGLVDTLQAFAGRWVFNSSLHSVITVATGSFFAAGVVGWLAPLALVVACVAMRLPIWQTGAAYFFSLMLFQPVAHPWYLLWALVFLPMAFHGSLWLYGLVVLWSYAALWNPAGYTVPVEIVRAIHIPVLALIAWEVFIAMRENASRKTRPNLLPQNSTVG